MWNFQSVIARSVRSGNCPFGEMSVGEVSVGEVSGRETVLQSVQCEATSCEHIILITVYTFLYSLSFCIWLICIVNAEYSFAWSCFKEVKRNETQLGSLAQIQKWVSFGFYSFTAYYGKNNVKVVFSYQLKIVMLLDFILRLRKYIVVIN